MNDVARNGRVRLAAGLAVSVALAWLATPARAADTTAELEARVTRLESELGQLKAQLAELHAAAPAPRAAEVPAPGPVDGAIGAAASTDRPSLTWFGYGELNYTRPTDDPGQARADLGRFVIGAGYRFDERTRLLSEIEIEHAVSSASDPGEVEIEQAYIEHELGSDVRARAGLLLIPSGLLNENHEPTRYYGVFRNSIETAIIPTTWREGGVGLQGLMRSGLRWDVGVTTGFDLSRWDAASSDGTDSPLRSIHQELALARAAQLSVYLAANYTGVSGLRIGASLFTGGASQRQPGLPDSRVTLWEGHARWQPGAWDFSALYARGHISNTAAFNLTLSGNPTLVPETFFGGYLEAAWRARVGRDWPLIPFLRVERFNTGSAYAYLGPGLTPAARRDQTAYTGGVQIEFAPGVILKTNYVDFTDGRSLDRFDLGLGYEF